MDLEVAANLHAVAQLLVWIANMCTQVSFAVLGCIVGPL